MESVETQSEGGVLKTRDRSQLDTQNALDTHEDEKKF